jgi:hypothetical protein
MKSPWLNRPRKLGLSVLTLILLLGIPIVVYAAWNAPSPMVVDDGGTADVGNYASLVVVNGNPAISHYDLTNGDLRYVRAMDASGTTWGTPVVVDIGGPGPNDVGDSCSLAVVNGNPAISYHDASNGNLKYVRAADANGATWGTLITVDTGGTADVGPLSSLVVVDGNPAISYYDMTNGDLKYVRATDASGSAWDTPVIVDTGGDSDVGRFTSLVVINGSPAIGYYDATNGNAKYVRATDTSGVTWGTPVIADDGGTADVGEGTSLAVISGNPALGYRDLTNRRLKYVRATDIDGTAWDVPVVADAGGTNDLGAFASLVEVNGNPAISYSDFTNGDLKYVRATDVSGTAWGTPVIVDGVGEGGTLAVVSGNPAIGYYDLDNGDLKYVRASDPNVVTLDAVAVSSRMENIGRSLIVTLLVFVNHQNIV